AGSGSEHDGRVAAVQEPVDLGRLRGFDLRDGFRAVLVYWIDTRSRDASGPSAAAVGKSYLRHPGNGLARLGKTLASLRDGLPLAGRTCDAACRIGPHGSQL